MYIKDIRRIPGGDMALGKQAIWGEGGVDSL
jgi:hypothetical protein